MGRFICKGSVRWEGRRKSGWMGMVRGRVSGRWRGNVLFPLSESFSCWQTSSWPFPSQAMNLLYFLSSHPRPSRPGVCVCVCMERKWSGESGHSSKFMIFSMYIFKFIKLMCVPSGESGLGKSTLINSLFLTDLYSKDYPGPSLRIKKTVQVRLFKFKADYRLIWHHTWFSSLVHVSQ